MPTKLETLAATSASLGFIREIEQVAAELDCPAHGAPIIEHRVETIGGWQAVLVCPLFDGECRYDPNGDPMQIERPAELDEKPTAATAEPRNTGGF